MKPTVPRPLVPLVLLCLAGCGLGDYEARMLDAQKRGSVGEAERGLQANLDDPLQLPREAQELFLRPPKGVVGAPVLFSDLGVNYYLFVRQAGRPGTAVSDVYIASGDAAAGRRHFGKQAEAAASKSGEVKRPGLDPLPLDSVEWDDEKASYSGHFLRNANPPLAVVYRVDKGRLADAAPIVEQSLQTLCVGPEVEKGREAWQRQRAGK
jgi:hypothetical protein